MGRIPRALASALILATACTSAEQRFADHRERGERHAEQGDIQNALLELHSALKLRPEDAALNERIGDLLLQQGSPRDAAFFYRESHRLDPSRNHARLKHARALAASNPRRARRLVDEALEKHPDDPLALRTLAELSLLQGQHQAAFEAALRAAEVAPDAAENWVQLGNVQTARALAAQLRDEPVDSLFEAAIAAFDRADEVGGGLPSARILQGRLYAAWGGHREQAERRLREAVELAMSRTDRPAQVVATEALADQARRWGDRELEREALRQLLSVAEERVDAWQRLAALETDPQQAAGVFAELLRRRPGDPHAHLAYAASLIRTGQRDAAAAHLEEVLVDGIHSPALFEELLLLRLAGRRLADARATFARMADAFPDDPLTRRTEGRLALATGRPGRAAEVLRDVVIRDESSESLLLLARAEHRSGNLERARAAIDRSLARSRTLSPEAFLLKARIHYDAEQWQQVVATLDRLAALGQPPRGSAEVLHAVALYELGEAEAGRARLRQALARKPPRVGAALEYARREGERDPEGAIAQLEAALPRHPTHRALLRELTVRDVRAGRGDAALERLNRVIDERRVSPDVLLLRADLLAGRGEYAAAEADALRAFEAAPRAPEPIDLLFRIYVAQDRGGETMRSFQEAADAGVLHVGARVLLARLARHAGDEERALGIYREVLAEHPDLPTAQGDLAFLLARRGEDLEQALSLAERSRSQLGRDPDAAHRLGYVYLRSGRLAEALEALRAAAQLAVQRRPSGPTPALYYHTGLALRDLGRGDEATRAFENALALDADFPEAEDARRQIDALRSG